MSHLLNKTFSFLFGRSSVSSIQKKTLIVNFKKAVDNKVRFINLKSFAEISFRIEKVESTHPQFGNNYNLIMNTKTELSTPSIDTSLGHFETKENADKALLDLNNKMYGKSLTLVSFLATLLIVFLVSLVILDYASVQVSRLINSSNSNAQVVGGMNQSQVQEKMRQYIEMQKAAQANLTPPGQAARAPVNSGEPPAPNFPNGTDISESVLNVLK